MQTTLTTPVEIELTVCGHTVEGRATLGTPRRTFEAVAQSVRHEDGSIDTMAVELTLARLLRSLEMSLLERIHEHIDRTTGND